MVKSKVKVKELIRKLKDFDENAIVIFGDDARMGGMIYMKAPENFSRGNLRVQDTPIGPYVNLEKSDKGQYLVFDLTDSGFFTVDDFQK